MQFVADFGKEADSIQKTPAKMWRVILMFFSLNGLASYLPALALQLAIARWMS